MNQLKVKLDTCILESKEISIWHAYPHLRTGYIFGALQNQEEANTENESISFFYARSYLNYAGFKEIRIVPTNQKIDWKKEDVYYCYGWTYTLPKKDLNSIQTVDNICLDYSDVEYSQLPEALVAVGKVRWRQICKAWGWNSA